PPEHWVGRKLLPLSFATYAHVEYWETVREQPPESHRWIVLGDDLNLSAMSKIAHARKVDGAKVTVSNTMMSVFDMVQSGFGIAVMPCYLGDKNPKLQRIDEADDSANWHLWLLAHPDVRRSARVNAFYQFATSHVSEALLSQPQG
ncbi:MAG: LysR substrate-binding domain-containing protein, partial [Pseudomonadota bacterium]